jgi:predicted nucleotidyltransferase
VSDIDADRVWLAEHGDRAAPETEILRTVVGSGVHGIAIGGTDDHDEMGVYLEAPTTALGLMRVDQHYVARTVPEGYRSGPGDVDLVLYALRKYLALVATGNPTTLLPLFAPEQDVLVCTDAGERLRAFGPALLSQQAGWRFLGYLSSQRQRLLGQDQRHTPNRPELVAAHGFDTKYASHALRLAIQGIEVAEHGRLTLPLPDADRELVLAVKRGEVPFDRTLQLIDARGTALEQLLRDGRSPLPERPDLDAVNGWLVDEYLRAWV